MGDRATESIDQYFHKEFFNDETKTPKSPPRLIAKRNICNDGQFSLVNQGLGGVISTVHINFKQIAWSMYIWQKLSMGTGHDYERMDVWEGLYSTLLSIPSLVIKIVLSYMKKVMRGAAVV